MSHNYIYSSINATFGFPAASQAALVAYFVRSLIGCILSATEVHPVVVL